MRCWDVTSGAETFNVRHCRARLLCACRETHLTRRGRQRSINQNVVTGLRWVPDQPLLLQASEDLELRRAARSKQRAFRADG